MGAPVKLRWSLSTIALASLLGALATSAATTTAQRPAGGFVLQEREGGVTVWSSPHGRANIGTTKVSTRFALPAVELLRVLRDLRGYPRWYRDCLSTRVLRAPARLEPFELEPNGRFVRRTLDERYRLLFVQHVAWMSDRFAVIENDVRVRADGALEIAFRSVDADHTPGPPGAVRMRLGGTWLLAPLDATHTEVSYVLDLDLATSTPDFLVAPRVRDAARATLLALGDMAAARVARSSEGAR